MCVTACEHVLVADGWQDGILCLATVQLWHWFSDLVLNFAHPTINSCHNVHSGAEPPSPCTLLWDTRVPGDVSQSRSGLLDTCSSVGGSEAIYLILVFNRITCRFTQTPTTPPMGSSALMQAHLENQFGWESTRCPVTALWSGLVLTLLSVETGPQKAFPDPPEREERRRRTAVRRRPAGRPSQLYSAALSVQ